ncbi:hypothetical protein AURDEDRAFT_167699 [Auricularia subglabra TFB-10046 SS5]|nr:hypothetical protein AURDEDRAFT_167699 [Auricularia subglabra TFB-10046 SS5]
MADIVEAPCLADTRVPLRAFCVISIDFEASVAALRDEQATSAAALIPRKKYLAVIDTPAFIDWRRAADEQQLGLKFWGVARGLPMTNSPTACVGLFRKSVHPNARPPILLEDPLPWPDCYVHTLDGLSAKVSRAHLTDPSGIHFLTKDDMRTLRTARDEDMLEYARLQESRQQPVTDRGMSHAPADMASSVSGVDNDGLSGAAQNGWSDSGGSGDTETVGSSAISEDATDEGGGRAGGTSGSSDDSSSSQGDRVIEEPPQTVYTHVELWLSLTLPDGEELGRMNELDSELGSLTVLEKDWARRTVLRILADQPHTSRWVEDVAAAGTPLPQTDNPQSKPPSRRLEHLVRPDDAIEHRMSRARLVQRGPHEKPKSISRSLCRCIKRVVGAVGTKLRFARDEVPDTRQSVSRS